MKARYELHQCHLELDDSVVSSGRRLTVNEESSKTSHPRSRPLSSSRDGHFNIYQAMKSLPSSRKATPDRLPKLRLSSPVDDGQRAALREESRVIASNSLFQHGDDESVTNYISEIELSQSHINQTNKEKSHKPAHISSPFVPSRPKVSLEHLVKDLAQHKPFSLRCNNVSEWEIQPTSVAAQSLSFRLLELILLRENLLEKLRDLLASIDVYYWKYCVLRIKLVEDQGKLLNSEELVLKRNRLFTMQNELSVAIAHFRSVSLEIIESLIRLRQILAKEIQLVDADVSIFWKHENYLRKMSCDIHTLFEVSSVRYWLGFVPNPLMIPPHDHQPRQKWETHTSHLFQRFMKLHRERLMKDTKKSRGSSRGRKAGLQQDRKFISDNLNLLSAMEASAASVPADHDQSQSEGLRSLPVNSSRTPSPKSLSNTSLSHRHSAARSSGPTKPLEEWEQLRDYCSYSWLRAKVLANEWPHCRQIVAENNSHSQTVEDADSTLEEDRGVVATYLQDSQSDCFFWSSGEHNPYVVEAAIGFKEVFPTVFLVPPMPDQLLMKCFKMSHYLDEEVARVQKIKKLRSRALQEQSRYYLQSTTSRNSLSLQDSLSDAEGTALTGSFIDKHGNLSDALAKKFELKYRQQCDSQTLFGVESDYVVKLYHDLFRVSSDQRRALSPLPLSSPSAELRTSVKPMQLVFEEEELQTSPAFITNTSLTDNKSFFTQFEGSEEFGGANFIHWLQSRDGGESSHIPQKTPFAEGPSQKSGGSSVLLDDSHFPVFTLEGSNCRSRLKIEHKIQEERRLATKDLATGEVRLDSSLAAGSGSLSFDPNDPLQHFLLRSSSSPLLRVSFNAAFSPSSRLKSIQRKPNSNHKLRRKSKYGKRFSREFSRLDVKWYDQHATNIQRMIRGFLSRRRVKRLRAKRTWRRCVVKLQAASRGFLLRLQSQRRLQEEKINTFIIRKNALKEFRSAIIITQFIRKVVNLRRLRSNEPILYDKLNYRGELVNRHRTFYKLQAVIDAATKQALLATNSPYKTILLRPDPASSQSNSSGEMIRSSFLNELVGGSGLERGEGSQLRDSNHDAVSIDSGFSQTSKLHEKTFSEFLEESLSRNESLLSPSRPSTSHSYGPSSRPSTSQHQTLSRGASAFHLGSITEEERSTRAREEDETSASQATAQRQVHLPASLLEETELSQSSLDEVDRVRFQKMQALALIRRVNQDKHVPDSLHSSRLIPKQETKQLQLKKKRVQLSRSSREFLLLPGEEPRKSVLREPNQAFVPPLKKKVLPPPATVSATGAMPSTSRDSEGQSSASPSLMERLQRKQLRKSVDFEDSWSTHASRLRSLKQEKEMKEQERFRAALKQYF